MALICYLFLELINRTIDRKTKQFSNFVEKIRICLVFYLNIEYVCKQVSKGAKKIDKQTKIAFETDLFS